MQQSMSAFHPRDLESLAYGGGRLTLAPVSFETGEFGIGAMEPRDVLVKRSFDIALALVFLALAGLPMLLIAAAIRLTSKGPALFRQERVGLNGQRFVMLKFRTMHHTPAVPGSSPQ